MKIIRTSSTLVAQYIRVFVHMIRLPYLPTETEICQYFVSFNWKYPLLCVCIYIYIGYIPTLQRSSTTLQPVATMYVLPLYYSACMLYSRVSSTLVISSIYLAEDDSDLHVSWFSLGSPCKDWDSVLS